MFLYKNNYFVKFFRLFEKSRDGIAEYLSRLASFQTAGKLQILSRIWSAVFPIDSHSKADRPV